METEFEVKILDIDVDDILLRLDSLGAKKVREKNQKRYVYDFIPKKDNSWIRLRTDGEKTSLTIKEINNDNIDGTKELEIKVDDFRKSNIFLEKIGLSSKGYQENKRISFLFNDVKIEIDFWPKIPPYLEIEGNSIAQVKDVVKLLGFEFSETTSINTLKIYEKYGINLEEIKELKF